MADGVPSGLILTSTRGQDDDECEACDSHYADCVVGCADRIRQAADTALSIQLAAIPTVFIAEGSVNNLNGETVPVAAKTVPAGPPSGAFGSTIFAPLQSSYSSRSPITILVECSEGNRHSTPLGRGF
jgi:hypothetical protein